MAILCNGIAIEEGIIFFGLSSHQTNAFANIERRSIALSSSGPSSIVEISKSGKSNTALRKSPLINREDISFPSLSHSLNLSDNLIIGSIVGRNPRFESILNSFNILDFIRRIDYWSTWSGI